MEEWNDETYKHLLTSNIWHSNVKSVRTILEMPLLKKPKEIRKIKYFMVKIM